MKITKRQFKAALNVAYEVGFYGGRVLQYSRTDTVRRIAKNEVKHAKARKLWAHNARKQVELPYKPVMEIDNEG